MKLIVLLALLAVGIGCSCAFQVPPGCGDEFVQVANTLTPKFNSEGQTIINKFDDGIKQLKVLIANGDIKGQSENIENIGAAGMKQLITSTTDPCLKRILPEVVKLDESIAKRLQSVRNPSEAAQLVCNLLKIKAQKLKRCIKKKQN